LILIQVIVLFSILWFARFSLSYTLGYRSRSTT
jgi:hypothetical protein